MEQVHTQGVWLLNAQPRSHTASTAFKARDPISEGGVCPWGSSDHRETGVLWATSLLSWMADPYVVHRVFFWQKATIIGLFSREPSATQSN